MVTNTTIYGFQVPTVGADDDQWGYYLNNDISSTESILNQIQTNSIGALPPTRPNISFLTGGFWLDNSAGVGGNWPLNIYSGSAWVPIGLLNTNNNTFISQGALLNIQTFGNPGPGTYTPTAGTNYAIVYCVGAGGGGAGSSVTLNVGFNNGTNGGNTTFGTLTGGGGGGGKGYNSTGSNAGQGGIGGGATGGNLVLQGAPGQNDPGLYYVFGSGGTMGGGSIFQGGGQPITGGNGSSGITGGGGAGGSGTNTPTIGSGACTSGGAGGGGGCAIAFIQNITTTSYNVGAGGTGGSTLNGFGFTGGNGGPGLIVVYEYV